jgi:hypothetical protein
VNPDLDFEGRIRRQLHAELSDLAPTVAGSTVRARLAERPPQRWPGAPWRRGLPALHPGRAARLSMVLAIAGVVIAGTVTAGALTGVLRPTPPGVAPGQTATSPSLGVASTPQQTPRGTPAAPASCAVTQADPAFAAPSPYPSQPFGGRSLWYGSAALWTFLEPNGEVWSGLTRDSHGLTQKTFWFSTRWPGTANEPIPTLTVTGRRLDGSGAFTSGAATNASSPDFGDAMLVGIEVPTAGCWQITGHYGDAELSYIVWIPSG